jgi:hypothetical protein
MIDLALVSLGDDAVRPQGLRAVLDQHLGKP